MKIKLDIKDLIKNMKNTQNICFKMLGSGEFSVDDLKKTVDKLKKENETLIKNCLTTTKIKAKSYGGKVSKLEVPTVTQSQSYKDNQQLIYALETEIDIANANNLKSVIDFYFTVEQIINYGQQKNILIK